MYLISVIIPIYNVGSNIENIINSLLNQTIGFNNLEIIFVDDNSSDNSKNIIKHFVKKYSNVQGIYCTENSGNAGKPRNLGLEQISSDYVMFLDSDDEFFDYSCELLYNKIIECDVDFVSGNFVNIQNDKIILKSWDILNLKNNELHLSNIFEKEEVLALPPAIWTKIYNKNFLLDNNIRFIEKKPAEDLFFYYECLLKMNRCIFIDVPIIKYTVTRSDDFSQERISDDNTKERLKGYLEVYNKTFDMLNSFDPKLIYPLANHLNYWSKLLFYSNINFSDKKLLINEFLILFEKIFAYSKFIDCPYKMYNNSEIYSLKNLVYSFLSNDVEEIRYIGNLNTKKIHLTSCKCSKDISHENKIFFDSYDNAKRLGYKKCSICLK